MKRVKHRYLALEIDCEERISSKEFLDAVWSVLLKLYGEYGSSHVGLALIDYNIEKRLAVLRGAHTSVEMLRVALASITKIGNKPAAIHVLAVSGTIRALHKKIKK